MDFEKCFEMSSPTSFITRIANELSFPGCEPALWISSPGKIWRANPSASWLRAEFATHMKSMFTGGPILFYRGQRQKSQLKIHSFKTLVFNRVITIYNEFMALPRIHAFHARDLKIADFAKTLSHLARIAILKVLAERRECLCGNLVLALPLAQTTVSHQITKLRFLSFRLSAVTSLEIGR